MHVRQVISSLVLFLSLLPLTAAKAQGDRLPPNSVYLKAESATVNVGQNLQVALVANVDTPAYGFGFQLEFDPAYLESVARADADKENVPAPVGNLFQQAQRIKNAPEPMGSKVQIDAIYTFFPPAPATQGTGTIASAEFKVLKEGSTQLRLLNPRLIELRDGVAKDISLTVVNATLVLNVSKTGGKVEPAKPLESVASEASTTAIMVIVGLAVLLALLIVLLLFMRRRHRQA